ncbi:methyltransferase domain-containing protein [Paludibaculum fermentans]|uniref:Methyltransferase domain-containing protein n=1 Tax=Paludibaculum fermentans TaxID=1473598 RepID=A0A7S7NYK4_PALFE|nr:methyltransferase domain-containing protein [Paludibaculum fermentans]
MVAFALLLSMADVASGQQERHPITGRAYAGVMGMGGAPWLDRDDREREENPQLAVKLLGIQAGDIVADVGAGSGYYTELLANRVGPAGKVYASDLQPGMLQLIRERIEKKGLKNIQVVQASEASPNLPNAALDLILMVDVYHEFSKPQEMLRAMRGSLKPGGRLVLLEYRKEDAAVPIREEHKMSVAGVRAEVEPEGFRFEKVLPDLPWQHILIFRK